MSAIRPTKGVKKHWDMSSQCKSSLKTEVRDMAPSIRKSLRRYLYYTLVIIEGIAQTTGFVLLFGSQPIHQKLAM